MKTSHHTDGPGSILRPGPGDLPAFYANDNRARFPVQVAGARGLVLSTEASKDGLHFAAIRLLGLDGGLSEPLHVVCEPWDIIALWRGLGRDLNLPMFLRDISGAMTPIAPLNGERVFARRHGSALSGRRPRFLARRRAPLVPFRATGKNTGQQFAPRLVSGRSEDGIQRQTGEE